MRTAPPSRRECLVRRPTQADDGRGRMDGCTTRELLRCLSGQEKRCDGNEGSVVAAMGMFGFFLIHNLSVVRRGRRPRHGRRWMQPTNLSSLLLLKENECLSANTNQKTLAYCGGRVLERRGDCGCRAVGRCVLCIR